MVDFFFLVEGTTYVVFEVLLPALCRFLAVRWFVQALAGQHCSTAIDRFIADKSSLGWWRHRSSIIRSSTLELLSSEAASNYLNYSS